MGTKNQDTKLEFVTLCQTLISGFQALADSTFMVDGLSLTKQQILQPLQDYVAAEAQVAPTYATYHAAVQKAHAAEAPARAMVANRKPYLRQRLGKSNPALESQFGVQPVKAPQKSAATKAEAAVKAKATRAKNHPKAPKPAT